jgi:5S rRNA maturation endonuclease (ribonuclease M5)
MKGTITMRKISEVYSYKNAVGEVVYEILRYEPKSFGARRMVKDGYVYNLDGIKLIPYHLDKVIKSEIVFITEGEKDANNLIEMGFVATTAPFGANKWETSFNQYFANKKVYVVPDNDEIGRQHANKISQSLLPVTSHVKILDLVKGFPSLKEKGDISDVIEAIGADETCKLIKWLIDNTVYERKLEQESNIWNELKPFDSFELPKFPIDCLPEDMKKYVITVSKNLATPIEMGALAELATVAVCLQGKIFVEVKPDYKESLNLYVLIIAEPGERKSPLLKLISEPLYRYERDENIIRKKKIREEEMLIRSKKKLAAELEEKGDLIQALELQSEVDGLEKSKTRLLRLTSDDFTVEALTSLMAENNGCMSVISSEGGMFNNLTGRYSGKNSYEALLKAYTGDTIRVDRKSREPELIENAYLTILLMAQNSVLEGIMSNSDMRGQGFLGRFLYCQPKSPLGTRKYDTPQLDHAVMDNFHSIINHLLSIKDKQVLKLSPEASKVSKEFFEWLEPQLVNELDEIRDWASKLHGTTIRIAGILHCVDNKGIGDGIINEKTMSNAKDLAVYFIEHAKKAFSMMGASEALIKAKYILKKLEGLSVPEVSKRDIYLACRCKLIKKTEDMDEPISILIEHGYIREKSNGSSKSVGRKPSAVYELNPVHFVQNEQKNNI